MIALKIEFGDPADFIEEVLERKAHVQHPIRTATFPAPPMEEGGPQPFITKVGLPIGEELLEVTIVSAGEASAEQAVKHLEKELETGTSLEVLEGSRYAVTI